MLNEIVITLASALNISGAADGGPYFYEDKINIPAGESVIETEFKWNAVTLFDEEGDAIPKVWYQDKEGHWDEWNIGEENETEQPYLLDILFTGDETNVLKIKSEENIEVVAHFYNTIIEDETLTAQFAPLDDDSGDNPFYGLPDFQARPKYISRADWGADESIRAWRPGRGFNGFTRGALPETNQVEPEHRPKTVTYKDEQGRKLYWPIQENQTVRKFVVHHTGEYVDERRNPRALMRAIYYFHTVTRGWGDIGYNFVIDKQGNIYEGRAGGVTTVGTHTAFHNVGTVGISLMGNFQHEKPTDKQIKVLTLTLADLSNRFKINATGRSSWLGTHGFNIAGHRDVARKGHGTACPGNNLYKLLPEIRKEVVELEKKFSNHRIRTKTSRDFLSKSKAAQHIQGYADRTVVIENPIERSKLIKLKYLKRGQETHLDFEVKNVSGVPWKKGEKFFVKNIPEGLKVTSFRAAQTIESGQSGLFQAKIKVESTPNGRYDLELTPLILAIKDIDYEHQPIAYPIQVSGSLDFATKKLTPVKTIKVNSQDYAPTDPGKIEVLGRVSDPSMGREVKIKLSYFNEGFASLTGSNMLTMKSASGKTVQNFPKDQEVRVIPTNKSRVFKVSSGEKEWEVGNPQFFTDGHITVLNYNRGLSQNRPYNKFRSQINFHSSGGKDFYLVNQLPLETYLWGLAEEPSTEPDEKKHAIHILARSYVYVYSGEKRKFGTLNYDLEDSPATSQFYLGYEWERYHDHQKKLIAETNGVVLTYKGQPAIGPYFTQSSGASSSKWAGQYPWTQGRSLPYDEGLVQKGHGVGLSGNSARVLAKQGKSYEEILDYFYQGIEIEKVY